MLAKLKRENAQMKAELRRLRANQSAGLLTSNTTGGVVREVNGAAARLSRKSSTIIPRWG